MKFIKLLLKRAGKISLARRSKFKTFNKNNNNGFVTSVDIEIGKYIYNKISTKYVEDSIECEDGAIIKRGSNSIVWYVDPLDGTTNYIHGLPFFAISISRYDKKKAIFLSSGIYIPFYDQLFMADGSTMAELNGQRIKVSDNNNLKKSLILTGLSFNVEEEGQEAKKFIKISSVSAGTRRTGSAAFDLCYVASGFAEAYYHFNLKPWDIAAGSHLIINAGGRVSNINSIKTFNLFEGTIIASNGLVHKELFKKITE